MGGGPAGLAAALRLAGAGLAVAVIERDGERRARIGETVPPQVRPLLQELGAWDAFLAGGHLPGWATSSAWGGAEVGYNDFLFHPGGPGWHLDRARFEAGLEELAVARGVPVLRGATVEVVGGSEGETTTAGPTRGAGEGWVLAVRRGDGRPERLCARFVVDATGRQAAFARRQRARRLRFDALAGAYAFFRRAPDSPVETGVTLVEAVEEGWWYTAAVPDGRLVACLLTDADLLRARRLGEEGPWRAQAARARHTARRLAGAEPLAPLKVQPASSSVLDPAAGPGWLAVGDAAATFDPLSSRGILTALDSGIRAADALRAELAGESGAVAKYAGEVWRDFERYLTMREGYYSLERRWPESPFWRRRQGRITLEPRARVVAAGDAMAGAGEPEPRTEGAGMHLPADDRALLLEICRAPRLAHELVAAFRDLRPGTYSDRRIVLAVQHLLGTGALAKVPLPSAGYSP